MGPYGAIAHGAVISIMYDVRTYFLFLIHEAWFGKTDAAKATALGSLESLWPIIQQWALPPAGDFEPPQFLITAPLNVLYFKSLDAPTALLLALVTAPTRLACLWHTTLSLGSLATENPLPYSCTANTPLRSGFSLTSSKKPIPPASHKLQHALASYLSHSSTRQKLTALAFPRISTMT